MGKRRGHGEGSVYQRSDGYWVAAIEAGRYSNGKRRRIRIVRRTKRQVLAELDELRGRGGAGHVGRDQTIAEYAEWWLTQVKAGSVSERSLGQYRLRIDNWVVPYIGSVKLRKLTVEDLQQWQNDLIAAGIGPRSRSNAKTTLSSMLRYAVGTRALTWNPAEHVAAPKATAKTDDALTATEADAVLNAASGNRIEALYVLALKYGLRQGELLALPWDGVDLDRAVLKIGQAKTQAGVRDLPLLAGTLDALRAHRRSQAVERLEAGPLWRDHGLVFCEPDGRPIGERTLRDRWHKLLKDAGVPARRFHASRHTAATLLLEAGVELEVVSAILGHSGITITSDIYAKVRGDLKRRGLAKLDDG